MKERRSSVGRKVLVALGGLLVSLVVAEAAVRVRQWMRYGTLSITYYDLTEDPETGLTIPTPGTEVGPIAINSHGFRGPEIEMPKPDGRLRLAFLGGSTTFCAEASSVEATWPALVAAELAAAHPEVSVDWINAGAAGYNTEQSLINLQLRVAPFEPDVLFVYHATNDLTHDSRILAAEEGLYDLDNAESSGLGDVLLTWHLIEKNLRFEKRKGATAARTLEFDPRELSAPFRARLTALLEACREVAAVVVVPTFSHRARRDQSPEEAREACGSSLYYMPFMSIEGLLEGFEEYNRVIRDVAREEGVVLVEGEHSIPGDARHFKDSVHFVDAGCRLQADRVLAALEAAPDFQALVASKAR